jgi:hypothetical protein
MISVLAVGACTTTQQAQQTTPAAKPTAVAAAAKPPEEKICTTHQVTGELMPVRECHTAEQWADIRASGQDSFSQQAQRHAPTAGGN